MVMLKSDIDFSELAEVEILISDKLQRSEEVARDLLVRLGFNLHADAVEMINHGPKRHGEEYERGGKRATRSADGEPAKADRGDLVDSVFDTGTTITSAATGIEVGYLEAIAPYGKYLEDPQSLNRPVLVPVARQNLPYLRALLKKAGKEITS